ncbi:MAG: hypothetical protein JO215_05040, partial [Ktedonobacteraceae bacterium]|nr:hypothetical protein [Ktedonobacteraceae bacterium]
MNEYYSSGREKLANFEGQRLQYLQQALDPLTFRHMERSGVKPGWHCLEVGVGEGSVAHWLAQKVGTQGRVVATDIDERLLHRVYEPNMEFRQHDIL